MHIKVYNDIKDLTGKGEEWLLNADGNPHAVFIDGNLRCQLYAIGNREITKETELPALNSDDCPF